MLFLPSTCIAQITEPPHTNLSGQEYMDMLKDSLKHALGKKDSINSIRYAALLTTLQQFSSNEKAAQYLMIAFQYARAHQDPKWFADVCNRAGMLMLNYSNDLVFLKKMNRTALQMLDSSMYWHRQAVLRGNAIGRYETAGWGYRGLLNTARLHLNKVVRDSVPFFYNKAIEMANLTQNEDLRSYCNYHYAHYLTEIGKRQEAINAMKNVPILFFSKTVNENSSQEESVSNLIEELKNAEAIKDTAKIIDKAFNLCFLLRSVFMKESAVPYLKIAMAHAKPYSDPILLGYVYYNAAMLMTDLNKPDSAYYYYRMAIKTGSLSAPAGWSYYQLLEKAIEHPDRYTPKDSIDFYYAKAMRIGYFVNNINMNISCELAYSRFLMKKRDWQNAGTILKLLSFHRPQMTARRRELFYLIMHDYLAGVNKLDTLTNIRKLIMKEHDYLTAATHLEQLYAKDKQYEVSKTKDILTATADQLEITNKVLVTIAIALIVFSILLVYLFFLFRKNKRLSHRNELLLKEQNHRVKNNLQMISSLISLQSQKLLSTDAKAALEESKGRINSVALLHRMLYEGEQVGDVEVTGYIRSLLEEIQYCAGRQFTIELALPEKLYLKIEKVTSLGLIINELLTNSIKHVSKSVLLEVRLTLTESNNTIYLSYSDNGRDFSKEVWMASASFGNQLIKLQSQQLKGDYEITSNKGFRYELKISA